jgi:hypothetical protein
MWMAREIERLRAENERLRGSVQSLKVIIDGLIEPMKQKNKDMVKELQSRIVKELYSGEG